MRSGKPKETMLSLSLPASVFSTQNTMDSSKAMSCALRRQIDRLNRSDQNFAGSLTGLEDNVPKKHKEDNSQSIDVEGLTKAVDSFSFSSPCSMPALNSSFGNLTSTSLNASTQLFSLLANSKDHAAYSDSLKHSSRATFTITAHSSSIRVANDIASKLFGFDPNELIGKRLTTLLHFPHSAKHFDFENDLLDRDGNKIVVSGRIAEGISKSSERFPVSVWMKRLVDDEDSSCIVVLEPVQRNTTTFAYDKELNIKSCDEELALLIGYRNATEVVDSKVTQIIPQFNDILSTYQHLEESAPNPCTCLTKASKSIPIMLDFDRSPQSFDVGIVHIYSNISGLLTADVNGNIISGNATFLTMLFGYAERDIQGKHISQLIPHLLNDIDQQISPSLNRSIDKVFDCNQNDEEKQEQFNDNSFKGEMIITSSLESSATASEGSCTTISSHKVEAQSPNAIENSRSSNDSGILVVRDSNSSRDNEERQFPDSDVSTPTETIGDIVTRGPVQASTPNRSDNSTPSRRRVLRSRQESFKLIDGLFTSMARHRDGGWFPILIEVKHVVFNGNRQLYCLWISRLIDYNESRHQAISDHSRHSSQGTSLGSNINHSQYAPAEEQELRNAYEEQLISGSFNDEYDVIATIGAGAFGVVKSARRRADQLPVVVKFILKCDIARTSLIDHPELGVIPKEVAVVSQLLHPNIIQMIDLHENDTCYHMIMADHGDCFDLFAFVEKKPLLDEPLTSYMFRQIVAGVSYLHSKNFLHRDIKDENVIINRNFHLKLIDFGSVVHMEEAPLCHGFCGTMEYCSPEVLLGLAYQGVEAEVWALGVTLYILAFGYNPFFDVDDIPKAKLEIPFSVSDDLMMLLKAMLQKSPKKRPSIDEIENNPWIKMPVEINNYPYEVVVPPPVIEIDSDGSTESDNEADLETSRLYYEDDQNILEEDYQKYLSSLHFYSGDDLENNKSNENSSSIHINELFY